MHVNSYGTFVVDSCIADAINSQYPDEGPFGPRVTEERGCIVNITSVVANPVPARCICYGTSKSESFKIDPNLRQLLFLVSHRGWQTSLVRMESESTVFPLLSLLQPCKRWNDE